MIVAPHHDRYVVHLDGTGHLRRDVGGKAAGIEFLLRHGFSVPPATVITAGAYRAATQERSLRLLVADLRQSALPPPEQMAAEAAAIERVFLAAPLPRELEAAIARAGDEQLAAGPVAVRSSATVEDLGDASFAGQYLTVTGVSNRAELQRAVRRCWASLWLPAARTYRRRRKVPDARAAMAVIVQAMVAPDWSGVLFTADPGGDRHLLRIEVVRGLGEGLVSGQVTPDDYQLRRDTLEVVKRTAGTTPPFLEDLARVALRIEAAARTPQDIEWAVAGDRITLLQTRPITEPAVTSANDGLDTSAVEDATYTPHGIVEMLPGVIPPLLWTINAPMLENAFRTTFSRLGGVAPDTHRPLVTRVRGRAALDLSAICDIARSLPGGTPAEVERQYLGRNLSADPTVAPRPRAHVLAALRSRKAHNEIVDEVELVAAAATALANMQLAVADMPVRRLVAYRQRIRDLAWRGYAAEVGASSAAGATYRALELLLERWLAPEAAASWAQVVTRGALSHSDVGAVRARALGKVLARNGTEAIREMLAEPGPGIRQRLLGHGPDGKRFVSALDQAMRTMGSKSMYGDATWSEDESWIWRQLQLMTRGELRRTVPPSWSDEFGDLAELLSTGRRWRLMRILTGQFIDLRIRWLRRQTEETIRFLALRERAKNALLVLGGEERRIIREAARRLVASHQLATEDLVYYLTDAELERMLFGEAAADRSALERRQSVGSECARGDPLPDWFYGKDDTAHHEAIPATDRLLGWAASPGRCTGPVRIVASLADGAHLQPGDVLVAHATDPSWTPLFLIAGAIVLEVGGPLSHAAIVAREFGLPAVLNVTGVTRTLRPGDRVTVDGTQGVIERVGVGT
jgi:phosphohistidine swiveling domain-containing protein